MWETRWVIVIWVYLAKFVVYLLTVYAMILKWNVPNHRSLVHSTMDTTSILFAALQPVDKSQDSKHGTDF